MSAHLLPVASDILSLEMAPNVAAAELRALTRRSHLLTRRWDIASKHEEELDS